MLKSNCFLFPSKRKLGVDLLVDSIAGGLMLFSISLNISRFCLSKAMSNLLENKATASSGIKVDGECCGLLGSPFSRGDSRSVMNENKPVELV